MESERAIMNFKRKLDSNLSVVTFSFFKIDPDDFDLDGEIET